MMKDLRLDKAHIIPYFLFIIPQHVINPFVVIIFLLMCSIYVFVKKLGWFVNSKLYAVLIILFLIRSLADFYISEPTEYYWSHVNHLIQFFIYYYIFTILIYKCDFIGAINSRMFIVVLLVGISLNLISERNSLSDYFSMDLTLFGAFLFFFLKIESSGYKIKVIYISILIFLTLLIFSRVSFLILVAGLLLFSIFRFSKVTSFLICVTTMVFPVLLSLFLNDDSLYYLYDLDFNTGIRVEFVRSALSLLDGNYLFGTGFNSPYRNEDYDYLISHPLLLDWDAINIVSNLVYCEV